MQYIKATVQSSTGVSGEIVTANSQGRAVSLPKGVAIRAIPLDGLASYPRDAIVDGNAVTFTSPEWEPCEIKQGGQVSLAVDGFAPNPAVGGPGSLASDAIPPAEQWLFIVAENECDFAGGGPGKILPTRQTLMRFLGRVWSSAGSCYLPAIDTRPWDGISFVLTTPGAGGNLYIIGHVDDQASKAFSTTIGSLPSGFVTANAGGSNYNGQAAIHWGRIFTQGATVLTGENSKLVASPFVRIQPAITGGNVAANFTVYGYRNFSR